MTCRRSAVLAGLLFALAACSSREITTPPRDVPRVSANVTASAYVMVTLQRPIFSGMGAATAINDSGYIVGWTDSVIGAPAGYGPTLWRPGQAPLRLPLPTGFKSYGSPDVGINNAGDIVAYIHTSVPNGHMGLHWNTAGVLLDKNAIIAWRSINDQKIAAGSYCFSTCNQAAKSTTFGTGSTLPCPGPPVPPPSPVPCATGSAASINTGGDIVGQYQGPGYPTTSAILWNASGSPQVVNLSSGSTTDSSAATHINTTRNITGWNSIVGVKRPYVWYQSTGLRVAVGGGLPGIANSISDNNRVVGHVRPLGTTFTTPFTLTTLGDFGALPIAPYNGGSAVGVNTCGTIVSVAAGPYPVPYPLPVVWLARGTGCDTFQAPPAPPNIPPLVSNSSARTATP